MAAPITAKALAAIPNGKAMANPRTKRSAEGGRDNFPIPIIYLPKPSDAKATPTKAVNREYATSLGAPWSMRGGVKTKIKGTTYLTKPKCIATYPTLL
jgi:hypothetical protein